MCLNCAHNHFIVFKIAGLGKKQREIGKYALLIYVIIVLNNIGGIIL
jgi:hypothetical protein